MAPASPLPASADAALARALGELARSAASRPRPSRRRSGRSCDARRRRNGARWGRHRLRHHAGRLGRCGERRASMRCNGQRLPNRCWPRLWDRRRSSIHAAGAELVHDAVATMTNRMRRCAPIVSLPAHTPGSAASLHPVCIDSLHDQVEIMARQRLRLRFGGEIGAAERHRRLGVGIHDDHVREQRHVRARSARDCPGRTSACPSRTA